MVNATLWPLEARERDSEAVVQEAGWTGVPVWTAAGVSPPPGFHPPDRPDLSQSLYLLSYRNPLSRG